ncbi:MAG TPA: ATP synthase subunit I [Clostridiaceae bacterium]|nr:ATP synthase subunit I [Clostridiaceae bacterium]
MFIAFLAGILLGILYFGGLYVTVNHMKRTRHPALLMMGSFIFRMAVLLFGFYLLRNGGAYHMIIALFAVILVKFVMVAMVRRTIGKPGPEDKGGEKT